MKILILTLLTIFLFACNPTEPSLEGKWTSDLTTVNVTKDGGTYYLEFINPAGIINGKVSGKYHDGIIKIENTTFNGKWSDTVFYLKEKDRISYQGFEFFRWKGK